MEGWYEEIQVPVISLYVTANCRLQYKEDMLLSSWEGLITSLKIKNLYVTKCTICVVFKNNSLLTDKTGSL